MRLLKTVVAVAALLTIAAAAPTPEVDTRGFEGAGSVGADTTLELYLLEGTYHHRLVGIGDCHTTASVFPSRGEQGVPLADVIHADLSVGRRAGGITLLKPSGSFEITRGGWANIQVGTGTECTWDYSITGLFLPEGEEPVPPTERSQWWLIIAGIAAIAGLGLLVWRKRPPPRADEEEPAIRVMS